MNNERDNDNKKEPKFKIVDKRRFDAEEIDASDVPEESGETVSEQPDETTAKGTDGKAETDEIPDELKDSLDEIKSDRVGEEDFDPLDYKNLLIAFLQTLNTAAWVQMGLVPHPQTNLIAKKMEEARKSINLMNVIYEQGKDEWSKEISDQIEHLLADLKANYVNQL
ncbi:MAG TPA: DUF1844 domain-containing protein [Firmicutes bacterium]|nr:DUF1844 domain-containing protein [Bacillota bacterium]